MEQLLSSDKSKIETKSANKTGATAQKVERENAPETKVPVDFGEVRNNIAARVRNSAHDAGPSIH